MSAYITLVEAKGYLERVSSLLEGEQREGGERWSTSADWELLGWARLLIGAAERTRPATAEAEDLELEMLVIATGMLRSAVARGPGLPGREIYEELMQRLTALGIPEEYPPVGSMFLSTLAGAQ